MNAILFSCAVFCLGSFGWGMVGHFRRLGKPSPGMVVTALLASTSGILQIDAFTSRPIHFPFLALSLYIVSATIFWWAVSFTRRKLAACGQGCVSEGVVKDGPYRHIRHPFYAAYNLTWLAGFAAFGWSPLGMAAAVMGCLYEWCARNEEQGFLKSSLAREYQEYRQTTGKYLPRIWKRAPGRTLDCQ